MLNTNAKVLEAEMTPFKGLDESVSQETLHGDLTHQCYQEYYTNGMALNPDKSHAILLGTAQGAQSFSGLQSIDVASSATSLVSYIKLLGVTLDSHLTMSEHIKLVSQSSFYIFVPYVTYVAC